MELRTARFVVIMLAALSLGVGIGHLMQLRARMGWDQYLWVGSTVQGGTYALSGPLGVLLQVATIIALVVLALLLRRHGAAGFAFTIAAAVMFAIGLLIWWVLVYPVNVELAKWVNGPVPLAVLVGMGAGGQWARPALWLRRAHRLGAGEEGQAAELSRSRNRGAALSRKFRKSIPIAGARALD
jgi:hypothetical protein